MRTILVHLNDPRRARGLLLPALALARHFRAHLIGFHAQAGVPATAAVAVPYGADVVDAVLRAEREASSALEKIFAEATTGEPFVAEWISERAPHGDIAAFVAQRGRAADLVVASQADAGWDMAPVLDFPERLALEIGRPLLVVPNNGGFCELPRRIVAAWNGKREAARAVFDALPLLAAAEEVIVLSVAERSGDGGVAAAVAAHELAAALARHGVTCTTEERAVAAGGIGETLLGAVEATRADLLVMGAYGHSRLRELVFGGATRHVLRTLKTATLVSH